MNTILLRDDDILKLIPQRDPIVMVDKFGDFEEGGASTALTIESSNIFCQDGHLREPGLIEHIAQSAAAFAGFGTFQENRPPKLGYIGEIKRCHIYELPAVGEKLNTKLMVVAQAGGVTLLHAETHAGGKRVAECQMKIFLKDE